jgi:hypothetical protein
MDCVNRPKKTFALRPSTCKVRYELLKITKRITKTVEPNEHYKAVRNGYTTKHNLWYHVEYFGFYPALDMYGRPLALDDNFGESHLLKKMRTCAIAQAFAICHNLTLLEYPNATCHLEHEEWLKAYPQFDINETGADRKTANSGLFHHGFWPGAGRQESQEALCKT